MGKVVALSKYKVANDDDDEKPKKLKATLSFDRDDTNEQKLEKMIKMFQTIIPIAEQLYLNKPCSSNGYALTNLTSLWMDLVEKQDARTDYNYISEEINKLFVTKLKSLIKLIGQIMIRDVLDGSNIKPKTLIKFKKELTEAYKKLGVEADQLTNELQEDILTLITNNL